MASNPNLNPKSKDALKPIEVNAEAALIKTRREWQAIQTKWGVFPPQAYNFVRDGLFHTSKSVHGDDDTGLSSHAAHDVRHVNGGQLCAGLRDFAILRYGLLARTVLGSWNIDSTEHFGRVVFSLIDLGILRRQEEDCFEDFIDVYGFEESFADLASLASQGE